MQWVLVTGSNGHTGSEAVEHYHNPRVEVHRNLSIADCPGSMRMDGWVVDPGLGGPWVACAPRTAR